MPIPEHEDIEFRGFVSAEEKFRLMAGAMMFVTPSPNESFSIVTLEAMAQETPVLVNSASTVLADHIKYSGAGYAYHDYEGFAHALDQASANKEQLTRLGRLGREYVLSRYQTETVRQALIAAINPSSSV